MSHDPENATYTPCGPLAETRIAPVKEHLKELLKRTPQRNQYSIVKVEARKLEHHFPHALQANGGSQHYSS